MNKDGIPNAIYRPAHYTQGAIECIDAMVAAFGEDAVRGWAKINAFKYLWRADHKGGLEDMAKAIFYLQWASGVDPREPQMELTPLAVPRSSEWVGDDQC